MYLTNLAEFDRISQKKGEKAMEQKESIHKKLNYSIIYSQRKTVSISIQKDGSISVRAPLFFNDKEVDRIVTEKIGWIEKKQQQVKERNRLRKDTQKRDYMEGSTMPYLGKEYPIHIVVCNGLTTPQISFNLDYFQVKVGKYDHEKVKNAFRCWYIKQAKAIYLDRIEYYQTIIKEPFGQVRIKEQKSCYGSCSSKRNLNFNWKCVLAPKEVLDYIVVHELCHLKELNHSKRFWSEVEKVMPDYQIYKRWLKENHDRLEL